MAIYSKLANINGKMYGVFDEDSFRNNMSIILEDDGSAVEYEGYILPVRTTNYDENKPGIYKIGTDISVSVLPKTDIDKEIYNPTGDRLLRFDDTQQIQDLLSAKEKFDQSINKMLETDSNGDVFIPPLSPDDTATMRALKECIIAKGIDIDKYSDRFGVNFPNDKRKLKDTNISLKLLTRVCDNLDIDVDMVFRDRNESVPNPMNKTISINIIPGIDNDGSIEL